MFAASKRSVSPISATSICFDCGQEQRHGRVRRQRDSRHPLGSGELILENRVEGATRTHRRGRVRGVGLVVPADVHRNALGVVQLRDDRDSRSSIAAAMGANRAASAGSSDWPARAWAQYIAR